MTGSHSKVRKISHSREDGPLLERSSGNCMTVQTDEKEADGGVTSSSFKTTSLKHSRIYWSWPKVAEIGLRRLSMLIVRLNKKSILAAGSSDMNRFKCFEA